MAKTKVDFGGVDQEIRRGGKAARIPEDDYLMKVVKGEKKKSEKSGAYYFNWLLTVAKGEFKGKNIYYTTSLKPDALWNLRNFIHAATGKNVAGKSLAFDPVSLEGRVIAATVVDGEPYEGRIKSEIADVRPKDELEMDDEEEDDEETEDEDEEEEATTVDDEDAIYEVDLDEL